MARKLQVKRGAEANLPGLAVGEFAFTTDQENVYIGGANGNIPVAGKAAAPKATKVTLAAASWDSSAKTQTVTVTGILADTTAQIINVTPDVSSLSAASDAGVYCSGQAADSLTFTCETVPTVAITMCIVWQTANYI